MAEERNQVELKDNEENNKFKEEMKYSGVYRESKKVVYNKVKK
jgi:hypothetical protein